MKLLDRQVGRELVGPFLFGVAAFSSVFFAGTYLLKLTNLMMKGLPMTSAVWMIILMLPMIVVYTLPMSTLLSVLIGVGRLSGDSEMVALFAGGVSLYRIVAPIFALGLIVTGAALALNEYITPKASDRYEKMMAAALQEAAPTDQPFTVRDAATNSQIVVNGGMDASTGVLRDVTVTQFVNNRPTVVVYAHRAQWAGIRDKEQRYNWKLYDGWWQVVGSTSPAASSFGESRTREIEIRKTPSQFALFQRSSHKKREQLSFSEMSRLVGYLKAYPDRPMEDIRELDVDRWNKLSTPLSSLVFALLAAPLGVRRSRGGSSVGFGLSVLLIFVYWMVWHYTSSLAVQGHLAPVVGAFSADAIGLAMGFVLLRFAAK